MPTISNLINITVNYNGASSFDLIPDRGVCTSSSQGNVECEIKELEVGLKSNIYIKIKDSESATINVTATTTSDHTTTNNILVFNTN